MRSIVREELTNCVRNYFEKQSNNGNTKLHNQMREVVANLISEYVFPGYYSVKTGLTNLVKSMVTEQVNTAINSGKFTVITKTFEIKEDK